jgi:hypothetical protein
VACRQKRLLAAKTTEPAGATLNLRLSTPEVEQMDSIRDRLAALMGSIVSVALDDGSRLDDCQLISVRRSRGVRTAWIFAGGEDTFVPVHAITDVWETRRDVHASRPRAA